MPKTATITLTTAGSSTGPFDLYSDVDGFTTPFESSVSKGSLVAGYTTYSVPNDAAVVRVKSTDETCGTYIDLGYPGVTTTTSTTSTTTTTYGPWPCGVEFEFAQGGVNYPISRAVVLGSGTGTINLNYEALNVPDRFIVYWNGGVAIDTGYRGSPAYDFGGSARSEFNTALTGKVDPILGVTYPNLANYPDDGYPRVSSAAFPDYGSGTASFNKTLASPVDALVAVYAPIEGTVWRYTLTCPAS